MANKPSFKDLTESERLALAHRVREMVEQIGTQPRAAEIANVSLRALEQYLAGKVAPSLLAVGNLAIATGHSLDWVLTGSGNKLRDPGKPADPSTNPGDAALEWGSSKRDLLARLREIKDACARLGAPLATDDEEDEVLGGIIDAIEAIGLPDHQHPAVAGAIVIAMRLTIDHWNKKRCPGKSRT